MTVFGMHWRNDPWSVQEEDFAKLEGFDTVLVMLYSYSGVPNTELHIGRQERMVARLASMGKQIIFNIKIPPWETPQRILDAYWRILMTLQPYGHMVEFGKEPNNPLEGWGGSGVEVAEAFNEYFLELIREFKAILPWFQIGFPGLIPGENDLAWLEFCRPAIEAADFLGCHIYWQEDNWGHSDWGLRYAHYMADFPHKPLYITEYGDSSPNRGQRHKAQSCKMWLEELPASIKAACYFILSSPDPQWQGFVLNDTELEILRSAKIKEVTTMPFELAFASYAEEHPEIGDPDGPMGQVTPSDVCQRTTMGVLWWRDGEGVTFYPKVGLPFV